MDRVSDGSAIGRVDEVVPSLGMFDSAALDAAVPLLEQLAVRAREEPGENGGAALRSLHHALKSLVPNEVNGTALLKLLDEGRLVDLKTADGSLTRVLAVETLLRLGYPWALQIRAEELEWFRQHQAQVRTTHALRWVVVVLGLGGALALLASQLHLTF